MGHGRFLHSRLTKKCVCAASMMTPPYPGMMYQTSQGMVYAAGPTSALPNGVIFSLSQGQLQLQHAADSGTSVFVLLLSLYTLLKHLFLCVCVAVCTVSSVWDCLLLLFGTGFAISSYRNGARCCFVYACQFSGICFLNHTSLLFLSLSENH